MFEEEYLKFWHDFGKSRIMVLSTALHDIVTSRTMSVIHLNNKLYFQTDNTFRKRPAKNEDFCNAYKECFAGSFDRYTSLNRERLFAVAPSFIERWIYIGSVPSMQIYDIKDKKYILRKYLGY